MFLAAFFIGGLFKGLNARCRRKGVKVCVLSGGDDVGKHLPKNKKFRLAVAVLEGSSYAAAGRMFDLSRQTAMDIAKAYFPRIFPLSHERDELGVNFNNLDSLRLAWRKVGGC